MTTKPGFAPRPSGNGCGHRPRLGFTLFEVSISLVLVAFGVVSVLMLFPSGLKAQQMARFQIYAAAKAEEMLEQFNGTQHSNPAIDSEGMAMWDVPVAHKAQSWDLESRLSSHRFGIMPLPLELSRRLDSDGDEIQHILDEGGYVYYSQPLAATGTQEQGAAASPPNEAQKLIIGVKGYAQQNALSSFPLKNWPYHTPWPSPPVQMQHMPDKWLPAKINKTMGNYRTAYYSYYSWPWKDNEDQRYNNWENIRNNSENYCVPWETSPPIPPLFPGDPDIQKVYDWPDDLATNMVKPNYPEGSAEQMQPLHVGYFPYACGRLWESGGYNLPAWEQFLPSPPAIAGTRHHYAIGDLVLYSGANYRCKLAHDANTNPVSNVPTNVTFWEKIDNNFPATHLEQITRTIPGNKGTSGQAVYGEYPSRPSVGRYVASTIWYAEKKGFGWSSINTVKNPYLGFTDTDDRNHWKEVQVFRFLAHATTCLTAWYSYTSAEPENLSTGITIPQVSLAGIMSPMNVKITHDLIKYYHERSLHLINLFASSYPYDWAVPRPLNRVTMMDYPLFQFDIFTPALPLGLPSNPLYNSTTENAPQQGMTVTIANDDYSHLFGRTDVEKPQQWRVVSPEPVRNIGVSATFPTNVIDATMRKGSYSSTSHFGDIDHYNITAKFEAAERCRELIFWVADWQSYEDFETLPSAPVDASKFPNGGPRGDWHGADHIVPTRRTRSFTDRMGDLEFRDEQLWSYRNPEKTLLFYPLTESPDPTKEGWADINGTDPRTFATGTDVSKYMILNWPFGGRQISNSAAGGDGGAEYPDKGSGQVNRMVFNGLYGADRNFNKRLDRGPLPKSVRLRAIEVARFNFYDPRVPAVLR